MNIVMLLFKDILYDARVQREAIGLAENGYKVHLFCIKEYEESVVLHENINIVRMPLATKRLKRKTVAGSPLLSKVKRAIKKLSKDILSNQEFYKYIKRHLTSSQIVPNAIHCHDLNTLPVGYFLYKLYKATLVYDSHELFNEMASKNKLEKSIGYMVEGYLIKKIHYLITVNQIVQEEFIKRYGEMRAFVVQNIPVNNLEPNIEKMKIPNLREIYGIKSSDVLLIYQGGINAERGLEICIKALTLLPDEYKLVLIGDGRIKENLKQLVIELSLTGRVHFYDQVPSDRLLYYTKQADIGLVMYENTCNNNYLSTPNKIYEYMLAEIPTVSSNHPGKSFVIEKEKTGVCVEENIHALRDGILTIMGDYESYKENCKRNKTKYNWENEVQKLLLLYKEIEEQR